MNLVSATRANAAVARWTTVPTPTADAMSNTQADYNISEDRKGLCSDACRPVAALV